MSLGGRGRNNAISLVSHTSACNLPRIWQVHWDGEAAGGDGAARCFYRSGVECTADILPELLPALRIALGKQQALEGERYTWLRRAHGKLGGQEAPAVRNLILDGELLVWDEQDTPPEYIRAQTLE